MYRAPKQESKTGGFGSLMLDTYIKCVYKIHRRDSTLIVLMDLTVGAISTHLHLLVFTVMLLQYVSGYANIHIKNLYIR